MQTKEPHERRRHALAVAATLTALVFVLWVVTLGVRMNNHQVAAQEQSAAAAAADAATQAQLQVSQTSVYSQ